MKNFLMSIGMLLSSSTRLKDTAEKVSEILKTIVGPCFTVLASLGVIYMVVLGVQYAKSESDDKRAETKKRIVNLAIGVVIMVLMLTICFAIQWDVIIPDLFGYVEQN